MKSSKWCSLLVLVTCLAHPARAATWSIGPSVGFDVYSASGSSFAIVAAPNGSDLFGIRPGLRLGAWDSGQHHQVFTDMSLLVLSGSGFTGHQFAGTLNYAYAFSSGSSPYLTGGLGFANIGDSGSSETVTLFGLGVGGRHRLAHGHGAIRIEGRFDRANSPGLFAESLNIIGLRVGFDLDLN